MRHPMLPLAFRLVAVAAACSFLAACGGGGGGGGSSSPAATPTPTSLPVSSSAVVYCNGSGTLQTTFASNPSTPSVQTPSVYTIGATPNTVVAIDGTPITSPLPYQYTPAESGSAHSVTFNGMHAVYVAQTFNGPHQIYFNSVADVASSFNTSTISNQSAGRATLSLENGSASSAIHRPFERIAAGTSDVSQSRLVVKYRSSLPESGARSIASIESLLADHGSDIGPIQNGIRTRAINLRAGQSITTVQARLRASADVVDVQPIHLRYLKTTVPAPASDTLFKYQWDMQTIGAPNAWSYSPAGVGATVAVIDTGVDNTHPDLVGKITREECDVHGQTYVGGTSAQDTNGHGTNVAGIAAADTNNAFGFASVGNKVSLQAYKIFPNETATGAEASADTADESAAIYDAVANGADVINLSLGSQQGLGSYDTTEHDAVEYAIAHKVVVVAAAGNENVNTLDFPAAYDGVLSVGASALDDGNSDQKTTPPYSSSFKEFVPLYANSSPTMTIVAPGGGCRAGCDASNVPGANDNDTNHWIYNISTSTAIPAADQCSNKPDVIGQAGDCQALFVGTSQSTPHVSGAVGLIIANKGKGVLTPASIISLLESTADTIGDAREGHGRLNAYRALAISSNDPLPPTHVTAAEGFVAFAYTNGGIGSNIPKIADVTYPYGAPVSSTGTFDIGDIPASTGTYRIAVWFNAHGGTDGRILAGDQFGAATAACPGGGAPCAISPITIGVVAPGFTLP